MIKAAKIEMYTLHQYGDITNLELINIELFFGGKCSTQRKTIVVATTNEKFHNNDRIMVVLTILMMVAVIILWKQPQYCGNNH